MFNSDSSPFSASRGFGRSWMRLLAIPLASAREYHRRAREPISFLSELGVATFRVKVVSPPSLDELRSRRGMTLLSCTQPDDEGCAVVLLCRYGAPPFDPAIPLSTLSGSDATAPAAYRRRPPMRSASTSMWRRRSVTIRECRPPWKPEWVEWSRKPVAQLRYDGVGSWRLYAADRNGRWLPYPTPAAPQVARLLDKLGADPTVIFLGLTSTPTRPRPPSRRVFSGGGTFTARIRICPHGHEPRSAKWHTTDVVDEPLSDPES